MSAEQFRSELDALHEAERPTSNFEIPVRAIDGLHVACARALGTETFLTCDGRQSVLAKSVGLRIRLIGTLPAPGA